HHRDLGAELQQAAEACAFHDASSLVFVGVAVLGGWLLEQRRRREMLLTPSSRTPLPWRQVVLFVWLMLAATYTTEFGMRVVQNCPT
ncbi:MAG: hypothetical protein AAF675_08955, partial [Pseudomonadota bacterium]